VNGKRKKKEEVTRKCYIPFNYMMGDCESERKEDELEGDVGMIFTNIN